MSLTDTNNKAAAPKDVTSDIDSLSRQLSMRLIVVVHAAQTSNGSVIFQDLNGDSYYASVEAMEACFKGFREGKSSSLAISQHADENEMTDKLVRITADTYRTNISQKMRLACAIMAHFTSDERYANMIEMSRPIDVQQDTVLNASGTMPTARTA